MNYVYYFDEGARLAIKANHKMSHYLLHNPEDNVRVFNDICVYKYNIISLIAYAGKSVVSTSIQLSELIDRDYYIKAIRTICLGFESKIVYNTDYTEIFDEYRNSYRLSYCNHIRRIRPFEQIQSYSSIKDGFIWFDETGLLGVDYTFLTYEEALKSFNKYIEECL